MTIETAIALGTTAGSLITWGLTQARNLGRIEGRLERSAEAQGKRIGDLEERVKALETMQAPPAAG